MSRFSYEHVLAIKDFNVFPVLTVHFHSKCLFYRDEAVIFSHK